MTFTTASELDDVLRVCAFLSLVYAGGLIVRKLKGPSLIGELVAGIIFGPEEVDLIPEKLVEMLRTLGYVGLIMLVFQGGVAMDMAAIKRVGIRSLVLGFTGTVLPILFGWGLMLSLNYSNLESIVASSVLASTAIGFTLCLMMEANVLNTEMGQLVTAAAMIDDVFSLVVLAILQQVQDKSDAWRIIRPLVTSVITFVVGAIVHLFVARLVRSPSSSQWIARRSKYNDLVIMWTMTCVALTMAYGADQVYSSYLLGTFMAGVIFTPIPHSAQLLEKPEVVGVQTWLVRLFFAASIGFVVPVHAILHRTAILEGLVITVGAVVGKMLTGTWAAPLKSKVFRARFVQVGSAMIGRGELGFTLAAQTLNSGLITERSFSATVWALVLATLLGPAMFRISLRFSHPLDDEKLKKEEETTSQQNTESQPTIITPVVPDIESPLPPLEMECVDLPPISFSSDH